MIFFVVYKNGCLSVIICSQPLGDDECSQEDVDVLPGRFLCSSFALGESRGEEYSGVGARRCTEPQSRDTAHATRVQGRAWGTGLGTERGGHFIWLDKRLNELCPVHSSMADASEPRGQIL